MLMKCSVIVSLIVISIPRFSLAVSKVNKSCHEEKYLETLTVIILCFVWRPFYNPIIIYL